MLLALRNNKIQSTIAYVVLEEKEYPNAVFIVGDQVLKKQFEGEGIPIRSQITMGSKSVEKIKKSDTDCAELFFKLIIPTMEWQETCKFKEIDFNQLPFQMRCDLKSLKLQKKEPKQESSEDKTDILQKLQ